MGEFVVISFEQLQDLCKYKGHISHKYYCQCEGNMADPCEKEKCPVYNGVLRIEEEE